MIPYLRNNTIINHNCHHSHSDGGGERMSPSDAEIMEDGAAIVNGLSEFGGEDGLIIEIKDDPEYA